jgi:hypothetical protein
MEVKKQNENEKILNINQMCLSDTPKVYKVGKKDSKRNFGKEEILKAMLFNEAFFDHYHIYKSSHCPEPTKAYSSVKNQEYIKALSIKASEVNKKVCSFEDYQKAIIERAGVLKYTPVLSNLLKKGSPMTIKSKFDLEKNKWLKSNAKSKLIADTVIDIDYVRSNDKDGFFIQCLFGKNITTENIIFHIENYGLDMLVSASRDILSIEFPKITWNGWILVIDTEQHSSFLAVINEDVVSVAKSAYEKRIKTLYACVETKEYSHYDSIYGSGTGIVQLPISKRTIDLRTKNIHW